MQSADRMRDEMRKLADETRRAAESHLRGMGASIRTGWRKTRTSIPTWAWI